MSERWLVLDLFLFFKKLHTRSKQVISTSVLISFGRLPLEHTIKTNCISFLTVDPQICSILIFLIKGLGLTCSPHCVYDFLRKIFPGLYSINWQNFVVWLRLLHEILGNICIRIDCLPVCDNINYENNLSFLIKPCFYMTKKIGTKI